MIMSSKQAEGPSDGKWLPSPMDLTVMLLTLAVNAGAGTQRLIVDLCYAAV